MGSAIDTSFNSSFWSINADACLLSLLMIFIKAKQATNNNEDKKFMFNKNVSLVSGDSGSYKLYTVDQSCIILKNAKIIKGYDNFS